MARKEKRPLATQSAPASVITASVKKWVGAGIAVVILGFIVLAMTDQNGQNWASTLSPFLILGGYSLVGVGLAAIR